MRVPYCLLTVLAFLLVTSTEANDRPARPNILLIFADDVGREVLGCYGGQSYKTPRLDALAAAGRRMTHCYSMSVCHPSRVISGSGRARDFGIEDAQVDAEDLMAGLEKQGDGKRTVNAAAHRYGDALGLKVFCERIEHSISNEK